MGLVLLVAVAALAAGLVAGGRLSGIAKLPIRGSWLLVLALLIQLTGSLIVGSWYGLSLLASAVLAAIFVIRNLRTPGLAFVGVGLAANALVVLLNGAMPVSVRAAERAGLSESQLQLIDDPRHAPITPATRLRWIGDVVPIPLPLRPEVVSPGDLLVAAGVGLLILRGTLAARPNRAAGRPITSPVRLPGSAEDGD